jgi:hypothetical protein
VISVPYFPYLPGNATGKWCAARANLELSGQRRFGLGLLWDGRSSQSAVRSSEARRCLPGTGVCGLR